MTILINNIDLYLLWLQVLDKSGGLVATAIKVKRQPTKSLMVVAN